jgi:hypothetical protein
MDELEPICLRQTNTDYADIPKTFLEKHEPSGILLLTLPMIPYWEEFPLAGTRMTTDVEVFQMSMVLTTSKSWK